MRHRPVPTDPRVRALVSAARRTARGGGPSRRDFLIGVLGTAGAAAALAACGSSSREPAPSASGRPFRWANWPFYLDQDEKGTSFPTFEAFVAATGHDEAEHLEVIEDNESFTQSVLAQLRAGQDIGYDVVTLTDWNAARWVREGWVQRFDRSRMPNTQNIVDSLAATDFDLSRTQSMTWQSGFTGIAWDTQALPQGLRSVSDLWAPELKGRVDVLSEMYDAMGLLLLEEGVELGGGWSDIQFVGALEVLREQRANGQIHAVTGNEYADDLVSGAVVATMAWSGDIAALNWEYPGRFEFAIPDAGGVLWSDNLLIPAHSPNVAAAEDLIDFYYDPQVAAEVAAWVNYITPVQGAREAMQEIDPELADNPLIFPDDETLARVQAFRTLDPADEERFLAQFREVAGL
jgi:spermidine/putrescine transport system substrate-binding protein